MFCVWIKQEQLLTEQCVTDCVEIKNHTDFTIREIIGSMMNTFTEVNPTSEALIKYFDKNKILTPTEKIPFSSKRKFSAVTFGEHGTFILGHLR